MLRPRRKGGGDGSRRVKNDQSLRSKSPQTKLPMSAEGEGGYVLNAKGKETCCWSAEEEKHAPPPTPFFPQLCQLFGATRTRCLQIRASKKCHIISNLFVFRQSLPNKMSPMTSLFENKLKSLGEIFLLSPGNVLIPLCPPVRRREAKKERGKRKDFFPLSLLLLEAKNPVGKIC